METGCQSIQADSQKQRQFSLCLLSSLCPYGSVGCSQGKNLTLAARNQLLLNGSAQKAFSCLRLFFAVSVPTSHATRLPTETCTLLFIFQLSFQKRLDPALECRRFYRTCQDDAANCATCLRLVFKMYEGSVCPCEFGSIWERTVLWKQLIFHQLLVEAGSVGPRHAAPLQVLRTFRR